MAAEMDSTLPPPSEARGAVATKVDRDGLEELPLLYNDDEVVSAKTVPCRSDSVASTTSMALSPEGSDTWQEELRRITALAWPLVSQCVLSYVIGIVAVAFIGHLGPTVLSAAVLGNSIFNVMGLSLMVGLSQGLETVCGQAYGAKQYPMLGVYLQRALTISMLFAVPLAVGFTQAPKLLIRMGQDPEIAHLAGRYILFLIPSLPGSSLVECLRRYLMAQSQVHVSNLAALLSAVAAPPLLWLFIFQLGMGYVGGAAAVSATFWINAAVHIVYVSFFRGPHSRCWPGFSRAAFSGWLPYIQIALPATLMLCFEWWTFEILILLSGLLPNPGTAIAAVGIGFQVDVLVFMPTLGFSGAMSTRVSNELGAQRPLKARRAALLSTSMLVATSTVLALVVLAFRGHVAQIFTNDPDVLALTKRVLLVVAITCFGDAWQSSLSGLLRAIRRTGTGAISAFVCYYCVGIPIAYLAAFRLGLGAVGLWCGIAVAANLALPAYLIIVGCLRWENEAARAAQLVAEGEGEGRGNSEAAKGCGKIVSVGCVELMYCGGCRVPGKGVRGEATSGGAAAESPV